MPSHQLRCAIPRQIYTYWEGTIPSIVQECFRRMSTINTSWTTHIVGPDNLSEFGVPEPPSNLSSQHRSDFIRVHLIAEHGGVWLDASCLFHSHIENWIDVDLNKFQGFSPPWDAGTDRCGENWAFAAPPKFPFVLRWLKEYINALTGDDIATRKDIPIQLQEKLPYLTQHACFVIANTKPGEVILAPSWDGPFNVFKPLIGYTQPDELKFFLVYRARRALANIVPENVVFTKIIGKHRPFFESAYNEEPSNEEIVSLSLVIILLAMSLLLGLQLMSRSTKAKL